MKHIISLAAILVLSANSLLAQLSDADKKELYPENYTFEKAGEFRKNGEYEKAVWFYINLFHDNKAQVIELVKTLATKLDTVEMGSFIKRSFAVYATFDPEIMSFTKGAPSMNMDKLQQKGAWGDELIQKISDPDKPLGSASEFNFRGLDKARSGNFREALEDFDKAIEIEPTGQIYFNRGYSKSMVEDYSGAILDYDKAIDLNYRLTEAYFERGYCKDQMNNPEGAIDDYTKSIKTNKEYATAYNNRAFTKLKQKDYKAAIKDFDKAIKIKPDFAGAYVNRGFAKKELGNKPGACKDWNKAVELGFRGASKFIKENCE